MGTGVKNCTVAGSIQATHFEKLAVIIVMIIIIIFTIIIIIRLDKIGINLVILD